MYSSCYQQTLNAEIKFSGTGLHTGELVHVRVTPAVFDTGIKFVFTNNNFAEVKASLTNVKSTLYATILEHDFNTIGTIEHLLGALFAHQVDNAIIYVDGPEIPLLDGSAAFFSKSIINAGVIEQSKKAKLFLLPNASFKVNDSEIITKSNSNKLRITAEIDFKGVRQQIGFDINQEIFHTKIARSKTFVHENDIAKLKKMGLIKGGTIDNAVVLSDQGIINPYNMTYENDMVRHKILDILGDFSLCGVRLLGEIYIFKPGHTVNTQFIRILKDRYYNE